jgi:hypothetical protein
LHTLSMEAFTWTCSQHRQQRLVIHVFRVERAADHNSDAVSKRAPVPDLSVVVWISQRQANEYCSPAGRRRRKPEVPKIKAHGLLVLGHRVPHVSGPIRVRSIKVSKPALGLRLLVATGCDERR